jgi:hypothetical protein
MPANKMKLTCPKCKKLLHQIGSETILAGDGVQCGLCHFFWKIPRPKKTDTKNGFKKIKTDNKQNEN